MATRTRAAQLIATVALLAVAVGYNLVDAPPVPVGVPRSMVLTASHMPMMTATESDSFIAEADQIPSSRWTATASDQARGHPASFAIDGNTNTFWESRLTPKALPLPHTITLNMHALRYVSGLTYLPRQDGSLDGDIGRYSISVSDNGKKWSAPVVAGTWAADNSLKTAVFSGVRCRYVRLTALTDASHSGPWTTAAKIGLLGNPPVGPALPRGGWTVSADSQAVGDAPSNVLDGDALTIWDTADSGTPPPLPHNITIDMHATHLVSGLSYLPRQDGSLDGTIGRYSIFVSLDGRHWGSPVASGTWADDATEKYAIFRSRSARFVRLTALSEAWATVARGHRQLKLTSMALRRVGVWAAAGAHQLAFP